MQTYFFKSLLVSALVLVAAVAAQNASADPGDTLRWQSVIGIIQGNAVVGSASGGNSVLVDTPLVDLDDQGDARFNGNVGALPAVCMTEPDIAFLIRVGSGRWIGNAAVLR